MSDWLEKLINKIQNISDKIDNYKEDTVIQSLPSVAYVNRAKKYIENGKFEVLRTFSIPQGNSKDAKAYTVQTKTEIKNISQSPLDLREVYLCLGAVPPTASDVYGSNLAFMLYDGDSSYFSRSNESPVRA